ncbi:ANTAR domain-containing protein [Blastococcus sp. PRF04-17]|uniref:ANTAR domain-containing protein n=1 Tax=Blastococcus sp. PRF04-17 TaxID=2933797 RepID=UPI001FF4EEB0|nr:ANTAR domain-containing protein [Blastococcus sp. PRF04-17]UOY01306.1 ANTAR domain-containing protein [Blastococcus sp. PRF04-17]
MIPGPRPSKGHDSPSAGRDRDAGERTPAEGSRPSAGDHGEHAKPCTPVSLTRTARGWTVVSPTGIDLAADLVEGMSLADLVAEELGTLTEPDRTARRSARGAPQSPEDDDPVDARVAALERTVAQLEHALAARVSTERAIGVLAERHGISARAAFETLRRDARSHGRPVVELAREVLDSLATDGQRAPEPTPPPPSSADGGPQGRSVPAPAGRRPGAVCAPVVPPVPRVPAASMTAVADGRS